MYIYKYKKENKKKNRKDERYCNVQKLYCKESIYSKSNFSLVKRQYDQYCFISPVICLLFYILFSSFQACCCRPWGTAAGFWLSCTSTWLGHVVKLIWFGGKQHSQLSWQGFGKFQWLAGGVSILCFKRPADGDAASFSGPQHSTLLNSGTFEWKYTQTRASCNSG